MIAQKFAERYILELLLFFTYTDVAYARMASSSRVQYVLIKENKGIKRNLRRNRVHFQPNKEERKQPQKGSTTALTLPCQSSLFLSISVLSKVTAPPPSLSQLPPKSLCSTRMKTRMWCLMHGICGNGLMQKKSCHHSWEVPKLKQYQKKWSHDEEAT